MAHIIEADLDALQNLVTKLQYGSQELEHMDGYLKAAYYPFLEHFLSTHRLRVEEEFGALDHYLHRATRLEQGLLHGFQQLLIDLQKEESEQEKV